MKYLKTYEDINNEPQVGDYVICGVPGIRESDNPDMFNFIKNTIGQIVKIENSDTAYPTYYVHYNNIPEYLKFDSRKSPSLSIFNEEPFRRKNITYWSKNKEELELKIIANKYNL